MAYPSLSEVREVLEPYQARIREVVDRAWTEIRAVAEFRAAQGYGPLLYPRTLANDMFDAIARYALGEFGADESIHVQVERQTVKFFYGGKVVARFKKGNGAKLGQNILTQSVLAFINQDEILPGLPPETIKVEFIWLPNLLHTKIDSVHVVARHNQTLLWSYEIEAGEAGEVVPLFPDTPPDGGGDADAKDLVRPRVPKPKADTEEGE